METNLFVAKVVTATAIPASTTSWPCFALGANSALILLQLFQCHRFLFKIFDDMSLRWFRILKPTFTQFENFIHPHNTLRSLIRQCVTIMEFDTIFPYPSTISLLGINKPPVIFCGEKGKESVREMRGSATCHITKQKTSSQHVRSSPPSTGQAA